MLLQNISFFALHVIFKAPLIVVVWNYTLGSRIKTCPASCPSMYCTIDDLIAGTMVEEPETWASSDAPRTTISTMGQSMEWRKANRLGCRGSGLDEETGPMNMAQYGQAPRDA